MTVSGSTMTIMSRASAAPRFSWPGSTLPDSTAWIRIVTSGNELLIAYAVANAENDEQNSSSTEPRKLGSSTGPATWRQ